MADPTGAEMRLAAKELDAAALALRNAAKREEVFMSLLRVALKAATGVVLRNSGVPLGASAADLLQAGVDLVIEEQVK